MKSTLSPYLYYICRQQRRMPKILNRVGCYFKLRTFAISICLVDEISLSFFAPLN